jgi:hypothetical protein
MPTVVHRRPRHGHFSRFAAGQLFQILTAEPGDCILRGFLGGQNVKILEGGEFAANAF